MPCTYTGGVYQRLREKRLFRRGRKTPKEEEKRQTGIVMEPGGETSFYNPGR